MKWKGGLKQELTANLEMKSFVESLKFDMPLEPWQAFFGWFTNAVFLYKAVNKSKKIHWVNFAHEEITIVKFWPSILKF